MIRKSFIIWEFPLLLYYELELIIISVNRIIACYYLLKKQGRYEAYEHKM